MLTSIELSPPGAVHTDHRPSIGRVIPGGIMSTQDSAKTDGELVVALRQERSVMAFEMLLKRYQRPIYGFIMRQLGDRSRAEEVFQETFLRVYDRIDTCRDPDAFKPWAFAIAANLCRNEVRRQQVRRGEQPDGETAARPSPGPSPEGSAMAAESRRQIERALATLPDAQREVFLLYHYTQLSYDEIAKVLEVPVGTVKSRMNAALTQLRTLLLGLKEN
jgi:RNA polymerase sigma-70 factor, ECF subfamily